MENVSQYLVQQQIVAFQGFGRNLFEPIPAGAVIQVYGGATAERMVELLWEGRLYIVFERDLRERASSIAKPLNEDSLAANDHRGSA